ncbi:hypothetical protein B484DRAFT_325311 [Ochromonadaceae sp. CCMP2298]|nr:hypothetical protein B484DRAFT_325311 [Ochromonadaceae sp. CCMP2298]
MLVSKRNGHHATVYEVRRDPNLKNKDVIRDNSKPVFPFVGGSNYKGSWNQDAKEGFGVQINPDDTKYEGEWFDNRYHGRGTLWVKKHKTYSRQYVGDWEDGAMEGQGVYYFSDSSIYRGGWSRNKKSGEGRFDYTNDDHYTGEWLNDLQEGFGTMSYSNGNIFEGLWVQGKKEGPGLYFYASTKKIYQGEWYDDLPRCGEFRSPSTEEELRFARLLPKGIFQNEFLLPGLTLANPTKIIDIAVSDVRMNSLHKSYAQEDSGQVYIRPEALEHALAVFNKITRGDSHVISIYEITDVMHELGLNLSSSDIQEIITQLQVKDTMELSFAEAVEIATFIHEQKLSHNLTGEKNPFFD